MRRDEGRDWERLIFPPIPERATLPERAKWRERGETFHGEAVDSGEVVDVALLGEWSPQFNALVDLYASHLEDFVRWRSLSPETRGCPQLSPQRAPPAHSQVLPFLSPAALSQHVRLRFCFECRQ